MQLALWSDVPAQAAGGSRRRQPSTGPGARQAAVQAAPEPAASLVRDELAARADRYVDEAHARNTRRAYQRDWDALERWCDAAGVDALPAPTRTLELYLTHLAELGLRPSTIRRARIAIGLAHGHAGLPRPDQHARIRALERGIGRARGVREEGAPPLQEHELACAVRALGDSPREDRDRAMLLVGFAGAYRASVLAALQIEGVTFDAEGVELLLPRSKEDQLGRGAGTRIPFGTNLDTCPVEALKRWIARVGRPAGPLFRVIRGSRQRWSMLGLTPSSFAISATVFEPRAIIRRTASFLNESGRDLRCCIGGSPRTVVPFGMSTKAGQAHISLESTGTCLVMPSASGTRRALRTRRPGED